MTVKANRLAYHAGMTLRPKFWTWISAFGILGLLVPTFLLFLWRFFPYGAGLEAALWPSSFMFLALSDSPSPEPMSTVIFIYAVAFLENCILYVVIGGLLWPFTYLFLRLGSKYTRAPKPLR